MICSAEVTVPVGGWRDHVANRTDIWFGMSSAHYPFGNHAKFACWCCSAIPQLHSCLMRATAPTMILLFSDLCAQVASVPLQSAT